MRLAVECYRLTDQFPKAEQYGLTQQIRRASTSIAATAQAVLDTAGQTGRLLLALVHALERPAAS